MQISEDKLNILQKITINQKYLIQGEAGTGKTLLGVLIGKELISNIKQSQKILYLTFSKLAKWQIKNCISVLRSNRHLTEQDIKNIEVHNFHSLWWKLLKDYSAFLGIKKTPTILLEKELDNFSEKCLNQIPKNLIPSEFLTKVGEINVKKRKNLLKIFKGLGLIFSKWESNKFGKYGMHFNSAETFLSEVQKLIIKRNLEGYLSHTETVYWIDKLLENNHNLLNILKYQFPVIIIDEFQDTDFTQWCFVQRLDPSTLIVLADKKQTIHQWRGANSNRIEKFCNEFNLPSKNIFSLIIQNRFETDNKDAPEIKWIELSRVLSNPMDLNTAKKSAKFRCKRKALEAISNEKTLAILCRTNNQADELTKFFRSDNNGFPGLLCERLGAENSPFEVAREILLDFIMIDDKNQCIDYLSNKIYQKLFPRIQNCTNRSRIPHLIKRYNDSINIYSLITENFQNGLNNLTECLIKYEEIKNWRCNRSIISCLNFVAKKIQNLSPNMWNESSKDDKRNIIDSFILAYENIILSSIPRFKISIMTAHQSKSREFDWIIIPWFSSKPWNFQEGNPWDCTMEQDRNLFHTARTRAKENFYVIRTTNHPPIQEISKTQISLNSFLKK